MLDRVELQILDGALGPEDVALDADGSVYTGVRDGRILRVNFGHTGVEVVADTGGRVLGIEPHPEGFVVCDAERGVFLLDPKSGRLDLLVDQVDGDPIHFANNAAVAGDGTIYFSQSTTRYEFAESLAEELEAIPTGRLLAIHPDSGETEVLAEGLALANGVAALPGGEAVLVAESMRCRLLRVTVRGEARGRVEPFVDPLPGYPDNAAPALSGKGTWVALPAIRTALTDWFARSPRARSFIYPVLRRRGKGTPQSSMVVLVGNDGRVTLELDGSRRLYRHITGVREHDGYLYFGGLFERAIARVRVPA